MKTQIEKIADQVEAIYQAHEEAASADAGFDAGEFSGPAHSRMEEKEARELCRENGVGYEEVMDEISRRSHLCPDCGGDCDSVLAMLKASLPKQIEKGSMEAALGGFPDYNTSRAYYAGNE